MMRGVVGLSIGSDAVYAVEVHVGRRGGVEVVAVGSTSLPENVVERGRIVDTDALAATLERLWADAGFTTKRVRMVVAGQLAVVRRTETPSLPPEKLRRAAGLDLAELLPFAIADAAFDVDPIDTFHRDGQEWTRNIVVAVPESHLADLAVAARRARLQLVGTIVSGEALTNTVDFAADDDGEHDEPIAVVDCDESATNVIIRDRSGVLFARTLDSGAGSTSISVADELESALAQLSGTAMLVEPGGDRPSVGVSTVVEGVRRSLSYYTTEIDQRPVRGVILVGSRGRLDGLVNAFVESLAVPVEAGPPLPHWPEQHEPGGFEQALGAALSTTAGLRHFHLVSDRQRTSRSRRTESVIGAAVAAALLIALFATTSYLKQRSAAVADDLAAVQSTNAQIAARSEGLVGVDELVAAWTSARSDVETLTGQNLRHLVVVQELAEAMPPESRLVSIQLRRNDRLRRPTGFVGPAPVGLITITGTTPDLDGVGRWIESVNATSTVAGLWLQQATYGPVGTDGSEGALFTVEGAITAAARPIDQDEGP